ncbi:hypothetical protein D9756_006378 [Leucocoprinus leucothites]|uniref:Uncharacterized protein n=1 Tax=Leucocoprinus leucothites TaxID=201217 RepID=A0A8H5G248_9AGAR|nr:hypothetical protein D9756_006378 [Leucoagaricus leucothites]
MTSIYPSVMSPITPNSPSPRTAHLMFIPRIKSKLSTLLYDSSDLAASDPESPSTSSESSNNHIDTTTRKSLPRKPTVSRLSFPFVKSAKSPSPNKAVKPAPLSPPGGSCITTPATPLLPSPSFKQDVGPKISPGNQLHFSYQPNSQRHNYRDRGYSRHALAHIKWFWVMREEDWETRSGPVRLNKPQLDESFLETALDDPLACSVEFSVYKRKTPLHPVHQPQHELPPMTIHPRRGDLASLRDPYCIEVDRSFVTLPTWTIGKTLWMYDVHLASRDRTYLDVQSNDVPDPYDESESESESLDASASSVGYNDDSDTTLVDSETESDLSPGGSSSSGIFWDHYMDGKRFVLSHNTHNDSTSPIDPGLMRALSDTSLSTSFESIWSHSAYSEPSTPTTTIDPSRSKALTVCQSPWATDWYRRWQCMIEVSHRGRSSDGKPKFFISHDADDAIDYFSASFSSSS